jgi:hypothetical protein
MLRTRQHEGREATSHEASAEVQREVLQALVPLLRDTVLGRDLLVVAHGLRLLFLRLLFLALWLGSRSLQLRRT